MKDFMILFVGADYGALGLSPEDMQARMGKWFAWHGKMAEAGISKSGEALHAKAKRVSGPDRIVTDGPFVEAKELIGGYYIVQANNEDEVIAMVKENYPDFDIGGSVEIREVMVFDNM